MWKAIYAVIAGLLLAVGCFGQDVFSGNATALQGYGISGTAPTNSQILTFVSSTGLWTPQTGGGGGGGCTGLTGQGVYFSGTNTCAGTLAFNFTAGSLNSFTIATPNTAGVVPMNIGFPGTNGTSTYLWDFVNQDTSGGNIMGDFTASIHSTTFTGEVNQSFVMGWNWNSSGGGKKNAGEPAWGWALEGPYYLGSGNATIENHYWISPINASEFRPITMQNDGTTGRTNFFTQRSDVGFSFQYLTGDGTDTTGATIADSSGTWTVTYSSHFPADCTVGSNIILGASPTGGTNFNVSGYNTGYNGLAIASGGAGGTTLTIIGQASGLGAGSGGTFQCGNGFPFAGISATGISSTSGFTAGGSQLLANDSLVLSGSTLGGGSSGSGARIYSSGVSGSCTNGDISLGTSGTGNPYECDGTTWNLLGTFAVTSYANITKNPVRSGTQPDFDWIGPNQSGVELYSDYSTSANNCGLLQSTLGVGGSIFYDIGYQRGTCTSLTTMLMGGYTNVAASFRGGATQGLHIDTSGNVGYGASAVAGVTAGSFSAITAIATTQGGVTTLTGTSDARLKTDIHPDEGSGLAAIMPLIAYVYGWNAEGQKITGFPADLRQLGFIAQNVQESIPEAIGHETHDGVDYLTIADRPILAKLVKAVQEQQAQIEQLKSEVEALKAIQAK